LINIVIRSLAALPLVCDIRDEEAVKAAINKTVQTFGGIDIVVNNGNRV